MSFLALLFLLRPFQLELPVHFLHLDRLAVMSVHMQAAHRAVVHANGTVNTGIRVHRPCLARLVHGDAFRGALSLTHAAHDAFFDLDFQVSPDVIKDFPDLCRVEPGMGPGQKIPHNGRSHIEHGAFSLALGAADARIDGQDDDRHVGHLAPGQHGQKRRHIGECGGADAYPVQKFSAAGLHIVYEFPTRLLRAADDFTFGPAFGFGLDISSGNF